MRYVWQISRRDTLNEQVTAHTPCAPPNKTKHTLCYYHPTCYTGNAEICFREEFGRYDRRSDATPSFRYRS